MNITLLSMQEDQEIQVAELVADGVPDDSGRIFEMGEDIVAAGESICEAVETSAVLENIQEIISSETAQIPPKAAEALMLSIEHMTARLGYKKKFSSLSLENYSSDPKKNIKQAMEGIKEVVGAVWDAIINAIDKVVGWVKDFFRMIFGRSAVTVKRAEKIEISLKDRSSDPLFNFIPKDYSSEFEDLIKDFKQTSDEINRNDAKINKELDELGKEMKLSASLREIGFSDFKYDYVRLNNSTQLKGSELIKRYDENFSLLRKIFDVNVRNKAKSSILCAKTLLSSADGAEANTDDLDDYFKKANDTIRQLVIEIPDAKEIKYAHVNVTEYESELLLGDYCVFTNVNIKKHVYSPDKTHRYRCGIKKSSGYKLDGISKHIYPTIMSIKECLELTSLIKKNSEIVKKQDVDLLISILDEISQEVSRNRPSTEEEKPIWKSIQSKIRELISLTHSSQVKLSVEIAKWSENCNNNLLSYISACEKLNVIIADLGK